MFATYNMSTYNMSTSRYLFVYKINID